LRILRVQLTNFRNFAHETVEFGPRRNLLLGTNAQGKTNVLEAIHILGIGRSHRDRKDANLVRFGETYFRIEGEFEHIGVRTTVEVSFGEERKLIRINGKEARPSDLIGLVGVVISSPDDIDLIKGPPVFRRQFLDIAISQISRDYLRDLQQYVRALAQRNRLLKSLQVGRAHASDLAVWDRTVIANGAAVVEGRVRFLEDIVPLVEANFSAITGGETRVDLSYEAKGYSVGATGDVSEGLEQALASQRDIEISRGYTLAGPHVDDFRLLADHKDIRRFGSEGEQRTAVLALRCAEVEAMKGKTGRYPIVLLDDVFAELDQLRTAALTALISDYDQIVLTSSRPAPEEADDLRCITIHNGRVEPCGTAREGRKHT
jgi:DNA replication and repair protein RecF